MSEHVAILTTEAGEEVLRMKAPDLRRLTFICPVDGVCRLYIVKGWADGVDCAVDDYGHFVARAHAQFWYSPPEERATWGTVE